MTRLATLAPQILAEVHTSLESVSGASFGELVRRVAGAQRIFLTGQGRTGLVARAFAMRVSQLGRTSYVVGETTVPAIAPGDILVACSGSGETMVTCAYAERARRLGAEVAAITARPASRLANAAHLTVTIASGPSSQLGNARFEQTLLLLLDAAAMALAQDWDVDPAAIWDNHANLE